MRELGRIRRVSFSLAGRTIERDSWHSPLDRLLHAFGVEPGSWAPASAG